MCDYLIVGAGFAGSVVAERLARIADKKILLVDQRSHIGCNAYESLALNRPNVYFTGRLATYKYYNMDRVVAQSLTLFKKIMQSQNSKQVNGNKFPMLQ